MVPPFGIGFGESGVTFRLLQAAVEVGPDELGAAELGAAAARGGVLRAAELGAAASGGVLGAAELGAGEDVAGDCVATLAEPQPANSSAAIRAGTANSRML